MTNVLSPSRTPWSFALSARIASASRLEDLQDRSGDDPGLGTPRAYVTARITSWWARCGGGEAADLLQALNTGHGGSLTTVHANNAESALSRIASCAMQGGGELPWEVTCRGVVDGIAMVIHMTRREGRRFVEEALLVQGYDAPQNHWIIKPIWREHNEG